MPENAARWLESTDADDRRGPCDPLAPACCARSRSSDGPSRQLQASSQLQLCLSPCRRRCRCAGGAPPGAAPPRTTSGCKRDCSTTCGLKSSPRLIESLQASARWVALAARGNWRDGGRDFVSRNHAVLNISSLTRVPDTDSWCCLRIRITLQCQGGSSSRFNYSERAVQSLDAVQTKWANGNEGCEQFLTESSDMGTACFGH